MKFGKQVKPLVGEHSLYSSELLSFYALILCSLAKGSSKITNISKSKNVTLLVDILSKIGASFKNEENNVIINGTNKKIKKIDNFINIQKSSRLLYLLVGMLLNYKYDKLFFCSDEFLLNEDLSDMFNSIKGYNIEIFSNNNKNLPLLLQYHNNNTKKEFSINNELLKALFMLSSICSIQQHTNLIEEKDLSDNLEIMYQQFGILCKKDIINDITSIKTSITKRIFIENKEYNGIDISIPNDTTFANYIITLAMLIPNSNIIIKNVLFSKYTNTFMKLFIDFGADIIFINQRVSFGEKIVDVMIKYKKLRDTTISAISTSKISNEYYLLPLISSIGDIKITLQGVDFLKQNDRDGYTEMLKLMDTLAIKYTDHNNSLIIEKGEFNNDITLTSPITENHNLLLVYGLFGLFLKNEVLISDTIQDTYFDLVKVLQSLEINVSE